MNVREFLSDLLDRMYVKLSQKELEYIYRELERYPVENPRQTQDFINLAGRGIQLLLEQPDLPADKREAYAERIEGRVRSAMSYIIQLEIQRRLGNPPSDPRSEEAWDYLMQSEREIPMIKRKYEILESLTGENFLRNFVRFYKG